MHGHLNLAGTLHVVTGYTDLKGENQREKILPTTTKAVEVRMLCYSSSV